MGWLHELHAGVDVFSTGHTFGQHKEGFVDHGHQDAVDHKTRRILHSDGALTQASGQVVYSSVRGVRRLITDCP